MLYPVDVENKTILLELKVLETFLKPEYISLVSAPGLPTLLLYQLPCFLN